MKNSFTFPNPWMAETIEDVIAVGGVMTPENIVESYRLGIFPWPHKGYPLLWFCPEQRGILEFKDLHIGRTLSKWIKKNEPSLTVKVNTNLAQVIKECRLQKRKDQKGSWINSSIEKVYTELGKTNQVISIECYKDQDLVSGIYGVQSEKYYSCESMFFKIDNSSKYAFIKLVEYLQSLGHTWMDLQMVTDVSGSFGARYIPRNEFLTKIKCPKS